MFVFVALAYGVIASYWDFTRNGIPNMLSLAFFAIALAASWKMHVLRFEYLAFLIAFSLVLYALGAWAGGDAKMFIALNAYTPLIKNVAPLDFVYSFLFAALIFLPIFFVIRYSKNAKLKAKEKTIPFAPFLTSGFVISVVLLS